MFTLQPLTNDPGAGLLPGAAKVYQAKPDDRGGIIDVISDFTFTASPITPYLKNKIPYILLFEYDVEYNSTLASALYYSKLIPGLESGEKAAGGVVENTGKKIQTWAEDQINKASKDAVNSTTIDKIKNGALAGTSAAGGFLAGVGEFLQSDGEFTNPILTPYKGLYLRKGTGFSYILPYYDNKKRDINTAYGDTQSGLVGKSGVTTFVNTLKEVGEEALGTLMLASPGAFIETPKFYNMPEGESITVNFDLINTINTDDYRVHYDFLFLLTFQNTLYRKDLARIIPPKMYRCIIPGEQEFPFCYISQMTVNFSGSRRILPIQSKITGGFIDAIIPDAYNVSISIKSLTPSSGNFMLANNNITVNK